MKKEDVLNFIRGKNGYKLINKLWPIFTKEEKKLILDCLKEMEPVWNREYFTVTKTNLSLFKRAIKSLLRQRDFIQSEIHSSGTKEKFYDYIRKTTLLDCFDIKNQYSFPFPYSPLSFKKLKKNCLYFTIQKNNIEIFFDLISRQIECFQEFPIAIFYIV